MTQANRIREFVVDNYIRPARDRGDGQVTVRAGDVHREMRLTSAMPAVCSAVASSKFAHLAHVTVLGRTGPKNGSTVTFTFSLSGASGEAQVPKARPQERTERRANGCDLSGALVLVSCVKSKRLAPAPARELYTSPLFTMARAIVEHQGAEWRILSALHGLVDPNQVIEPYEHTLKGKSVSARRSWAEGLLPQLLPLAKEFGRVVFFAGEDYRAFLQEPLRRSGVSVEVPMQGLSLGQQLAWLSNHS